MSSAAPAVPHASSGTEEARTQFLTFVLAGEEYGLDILRVQEIKGWDGATPIPNTPDYIRGVINLRGTIVPIVDLRRRFGLEPAPYGPTTVVVVLKVHHDERARILGIVVDGVSDVINVDRSDFRPPPEFDGSVSLDFVRGLAPVDGKMVILLEIDELLNAGALGSDSTTTV
jgi:purine-binding chemotaxis protein CheW